MYERITSLLNELRATNSSNEKKEILSRYGDCQPFLKYAYNPFMRFHLTSSSLSKPVAADGLEYESLWELLRDLAEGKLSGHQAIASVQKFMRSFPESSEILPLILDKNLKVRIDAKLINKVFPKLIPQFSVTLAKNLNDFIDNIDFENESWLASRKLDGVRVLGKDGKFLSRVGNEFTTLEALKEFLPCGFVLDGEMCVLDETGKEDFTSIVGAIKRKSEQVANPRYLLFDMLSNDDFEKGKSKSKLSERLEKLREFVKTLDNPCFSVVDFTPVESKEHALKLLEAARENGWEGMMFRKDVPYEGKRTKNLLKGKFFQESEYKVLDISTGLFSIADKENGCEKSIETLSAVTVEHRGNLVSVGSGFTLDQRREYFEHPERILGKIITVQYFEESRDKTGKISLRFPTVKCIHGEKREI